MSLITVLFFAFIPFAISKLQMLTIFGDRNFLFIRTKTAHFDIVGFLYDDEDGGFNTSACSEANNGVKYFTTTPECQVHIGNEPKTIPDHTAASERNFPVLGSNSNVMRSTYIGNSLIPFLPGKIAIKQRLNISHFKTVVDKLLCNDFTRFQSEKLFSVKRNIHFFGLFFQTRVDINDYYQVMKCFFGLSSHNGETSFLRLAIITLRNFQQIPVAFIPQQIAYDYAIFHEVYDTTPVGTQIGYFESRSSCASIITANPYLILPTNSKCKGAITLKKSLLYHLLTNLTLTVSNISSSVKILKSEKYASTSRAKVVATGSSIDTPFRLNVTKDSNFNFKAILTYHIGTGMDKSDAFGIYPSGNMFIKSSEIRNLVSNIYHVEVIIDNVKNFYTCTAIIDVVNDLSYPRSKHPNQTDCDGKYYKIYFYNLSSLYAYLALTYIAYHAFVQFFISL